MTEFTRSGWTFAQVPIAVLRDAISDGAKVLFGYLAWRQGNSDTAWPSVACIADDLGIGSRVVQRRVRELEARGWLTVHPRTGRSNLYTIHAERQTPVTNGTGDKSDATPVENDTPTPVKNDTQNDSHVNDSKPTAAAQPPDASHRAIYSALRKVCCVDDSLKSIQGRLNRVAKEIRASGNYKANDILRWYGHGGWWYRDYWLGQKGERPKPELIPKTLGEARAAERARETVSAPLAWSSALTGERSDGRTATLD
jgi:hypothetical protein